MMRFRDRDSILTAFALILPIVAAGCLGSGADTAPETPPDLESQYSVEAKSLTLEFLEKFNEDPDAAKGDFQLLLENLQGVESESAKLGELYAAAKALNENYNQENADKLKQLAESLPGDVEAYRQEMAEQAD